MSAQLVAEAEAVALASQVGRGARRVLRASVVLPCACCRSNMPIHQCVLCDTWPQALELASQLASGAAAGAEAEPEAEGDQDGQAGEGSDVEPMAEQPSPPRSCSPSANGSREAEVAAMEQEQGDEDEAMEEEGMQEEEDAQEEAMALLGGLAALGGGGELLGSGGGAGRAVGGEPLNPETDGSGLLQAAGELEDEDDPLVQLEREARAARAREMVAAAARLEAARARALLEARAARRDDALLACMQALLRDAGVDASMGTESRSEASLGAEAEAGLLSPLTPPSIATGSGGLLSPDGRSQRSRRSALASGGVGGFAVRWQPLGDVLPPLRSMLQPLSRRPVATAFSGELRGGAAAAGVPPLRAGGRGVGLLRPGGSLPSASFLGEEDEEEAGGLGLSESEPSTDIEVGSGTSLFKQAVAATNEYFRQRESRVLQRRPDGLALEARTGLVLYAREAVADVQQPESTRFRMYARCG